MDDIDFKSQMFDEALRIVAKAHTKKEIEEYSDIGEDGRHIFSAEFEAKMDGILKRGKKFKGESRKAYMKAASGRSM